MTPFSKRWSLHQTQHGSDLGFRYRYVGAHDVGWDGYEGAGLLYMHARHYHPEFGRFLQPDPSELEANHYAYAENSPVTKVDPEGTCTREILAGTTGAARLAATLCWFGTQVVGMASRAQAPVQACLRSGCVTASAYNHILRAHSARVSTAFLRSRQTAEGVGTKFLSDRAILPLIMQTLRTPTMARWIYQGYGSAVMEYAYRSRLPVGVSGWGVPMFWARVVVANGKVVTAYPARTPFRP